MTATGDWLANRLDGAPAVLADRVAALAGAPPAGALAGRLTQASRAALELAISGPTTRASALDLLAADALVTLALLARAEHDPAGLAGFAAGLRDLAGPEPA